MKKGKFLFFIVIFLVTLILLPAGLAGEEASQARLENLIEKGDKAAEKARFETKTETQLREALNIYERVLDLDPDNTHSLNRLSSGYYTLAEAYLDYNEKEEGYQKGFDYGVRSLRTNTDFRKLHDRKGFSALKDLPESIVNVEGLLWAAGNLGMLAETKGVLESLDSLPALVEMNERVIELDSGYLGAAAHNALGCISAEVLKQQPFTFWQVFNQGFSWKGVKSHFESAIEQTPEYLGHYFSYAYYYALNKDKEDLAKSLLEKVIQEPLGDSYPLMNKVAKEKAEILMNKF
ncbi:MAG: TRAP transporter TatT component family protein [Candidatus Bipolaricaulota bacterium]|nr:hypothetical protein [Candidatus Bipolaricaulota bacterium]MBS3792050.1 hypothetical protein [Candidatus Bipolaricaulota bacterium]